MRKRQATRLWDNSSRDTTCPPRTPRPEASAWSSKGARRRATDRMRGGQHRLYASFWWTTLLPLFSADFPRQAYAIF
eukprot:6181579-Pleurochrysis_carterae.AAC.1